MDKLVGEVLKSPALTGVGLAGSKLTYDIQENVYGRPNALKPIAEFLHNPDYLTSFTYPLALMYAMRTVFSLGKFMARETGNNKFEQDFFDTALKLTPVIVVGLNVWHELASRPNYQDNASLDILAGFAAGLIYTLTTTSKEDLKKSLQKIKSVLSKTPKSQEVVSQGSEERAA